MKLKRFTFISLFLLVVLCFFGVASAEYSIEIGNMSTDTIQEKVLVETYPNGSANPGDTVQISISAEAGYEMDYLEVYQVTDNGLLQINSFSSAEGSSFVMPDGNVLVKVLYTALNPQIVATGTYGGDTAWSLDENGTLTVSGTGSVTSCEYGHYVVKVIIQSGITEIGDNAFEGIDISEVEMADTVTSVGEAAFRDNWTLKRAVLSSGILHISRGCFAACTGLTDLMIPSGVISIEDFALASTALTTITIPSSVTYISPTAFNYDSSVMKKTMEFIVEDDNNVYASQDGVLFNKDKTELVRFPVGRTGEYTIPDTVTMIGANAFSSCDLSILTIPRSVTSIGNSYTFEFSELTDIYYCGTEEAWQAMIPNDLELPETTNLHFIIDSGVCGAEGDKLTWTLDDQGTLMISGTGVIPSIRKPESDCSESIWQGMDISRVVIEAGITGIENDAFHEVSMYSVDIPDTVTYIGEAAFAECFKLTNINIPEGITCLNFATFASCYRLEHISLPQSLTSIGTGVFDDTGIERLVIPANVTSIDANAFVNMHNVLDFIVDENNIQYSSRNGVLLNKEQTEIIHFPSGRTGHYSIPDTVTHIGKYAFAGCELSSLSIPKSVVSFAEYDFGPYGCKNLADIYYAGTENEWYSIEVLDGELELSEKITLHYRVVAGVCGAEGDNITWTLDDQGTLTISGTGEIGAGPFWNGLDSDYYVINAEISEGVTSIGMDAFGDCGVNRVFIPSTVTNIGDRAFYLCGINSIYIPKSVVSIGNYAFLECGEYLPNGYEISNVYYGGSEDDWSLISIGNGNEALINAANIYYDYPEAQKNGTCGDQLTWQLDEHGTLTISGTGDMSDYGAMSSHSPWRFRCAECKQVVIEEGVTSIGNWAFSNCQNLTTVFLPESLNRIGNFAFSDCEKITRVIYDGSKNSWKEIDIEILAGLSNDIVVCNDGILPKVVMNGTCGAEENGENLNWMLDEEGTLTISGTGEMGNYSSGETPWFENREMIGKVIVKNGITSIGDYAFCETSMERIDLPESITYIGESAFRETNLTSISIPDGVKKICDGTFFGCASLVRVTIPETVIIIGSYAFEDCTGLTYLTLPNHLISIYDYAFSGCINLNNVMIPTSVKTIGYAAFRSCRCFTDINIPYSVTFISDEAFSNCRSLVNIMVSNENLQYCSVDGVLFNRRKTELVCYPAGITTSSYSIPDSVVYITSGAFSYADQLNHLTIPNSVIRICYDAFKGCSSLAEISYDGSEDEWQTVDVHEGNENLLNASIICQGSGITWTLDEEGVLTISGNGRMKNYEAWTGAPWNQENADLIRTVVIEEGVISIGNFAFRYCENLSSITIPESIIRIGDFVFPAQLTSISIPAGVQEIGQFEDSSSWSNLIEINVSQDNQAYSSVDGVLYNKAMTELIKYPQKKQGTTFVIPDTVTAIGSVSCNWTQFSSVVMPSGLKTIAEHAFEGCNLTELVIPNSVRYIGDYAFVMSQNLTHVTIPASVTAMGENIFGEGLSKVVFADGFTHITNGLFECSPNLGIVTIPSSVTTIDDYVFMMDSLAFVLYAGTEDQWNMVSIGKNNAGLDHATIIFNYASGLMILANGTCGNNVTWRLDNDGMLTISGTGTMIDYGSEDETPWYPYRNMIHKIIIDNSVTSIGDNAFNSLAAQSVSIPECITSIGSMAFYNCNNLKSIIIPASITSIGNAAFGGGSGLESIYVAEENETYSSDEYGVLFNQIKTQLICYPHGREGEYIIPETVIEINPEAFACSSKLSGITIPESVTMIEAGTFATCSRLRSIIIPDSIIWIDQYAFDDCYNLTEITFQSAETSWDSEAFSNCWSLTSVIVPCNWVGETVLLNEESGNIPITDRIHKWGEITYNWSEDNTTVEAKRVCAHDETHVECETVASTRMIIIAPSDDENGVFDWVSNAFTNDVFTIQHAPGGTIPSLGTLSVLRLPANLTVIEEEAFTGLSCQAVILPEGCTTIGSGAFASCTELLYVLIPESVTSIASDAFDGCDLVVVDRR